MSIRLPDRSMLAKQEFKPCLTATPHQNACIQAKNNGILSLAFHLLYTDQLRKESKGPFMVENALALITDTLLTLQDNWITLILTNRLYRLYKYRTHQLLQQATDGPAIYGMFLCDEAGAVPNVKEMEAALELMTEYVKDYGEDDYQRPIDTIAAVIDALSPRVQGRDWSQTSTAIATWKLSKGVRLAHPRRYCHTSRVRQWKKLFITQYTARAAATEDHWPLLHEAILFHLYPNKKYFLRFTVLYRIWDPAMTPVAEHILSLLTNAYNRMGGLNGKDIGDVTLATTSSQIQHRGIWVKNALQIQQDYIRGSKTVFEHVVFKRLMSDYPTDENEVVAQTITKSVTEQVQMTM